MALSVNPNPHRETDAARLAQLSQDGECYDEMGKAITLALLSQPRWITRTTSGKWQRARTRERLAELADVTAADRTESEDTP